jgi:MFS family permease
MRQGRLLAVLASAQLLIALDHNIVYVALPEITRSLRFEDGAEQWVVSAYALGFGGMLLVGGRVTDVAGARRVLVAALCVHGAAAAIGGAAGSPAVLIAARAAQGVGSALLFPATLALLNASFEGTRRARALATWGAAGASGGAFGSLLGGLLAGSLGWRSVLLCVVPVAGGAAVVAARVLRENAGSRDGVRSGAWRQAPSALSGTAAATLAILALGQGTTSGWPAVTLASCGLAAVASAALFRLLERRAREPLIPPVLLRCRDVGAATLLAFAFMASFGGQFYLLSVHLQDDVGLGATVAGAAFLPLTLAILAGTQAGGRILTRAGARRTALAGFGLGAAGLAGCAVAVSAGWLPALGLALALDGLGQGIAWTGMWALVADAGNQGVANGVVATFQQLGGAAGLALWVAVAHTTASFLIAASLVLAAAAALAADKGRDGAL